MVLLKITLQIQKLLTSDFHYHFGAIATLTNLFPLKILFFGFLYTELFLFSHNLLLYFGVYLFCRPAGFAEGEKGAECRPEDDQCQS